VYIYSKQLILHKLARWDIHVHVYKLKHIGAMLSCNSDVPFNKTFFLSYMRYCNNFFLLNKL